MAADRDEGSPILHVDMDAFFASVEVRNAPQLRGRPVIVGGGTRGVVLSATYEARRFGVRSAMPMGRALRLCPSATVVRPDHTAYRETSREIMKIFDTVTPLVQPVSVDEAFLDVAGARRRLGSPAAIARQIRARVSDEQGITCSVGVAPSMFVAKVASTRCKPDGMCVVPADEVTAFLHPLPATALWGVGATTERALARVGLRTIGDIARAPADTVRRAVGGAAGSHLHALANGHDPRSVTPHDPGRSVGAEETFDTDTCDTTRVVREILRLSERTGARLRASGHAGRTIAIKIRYADFTTVSRSRTLPDPTDVTHTIYDTARSLFEALNTGDALLRLVGVRVEGLVQASSVTRQLQLGERPTGWSEADRAVDQAARRFGPGTVTPGSLLAGERLDPVVGGEGSQ